MDLIMLPNGLGLVSSARDGVYPCHVLGVFASDLPKELNFRFLLLF